MCRLDVIAGVGHFLIFVFVCLLVENAGSRLDLFQVLISMYEQERYMSTVYQ